MQAMFRSPKASIIVFDFITNFIWKLFSKKKICFLSFNILYVMKNNSKKIIFLIQKIFYTSKSFLHISVIYPAGNYMFKVNNTNFRTRTLKRHQWRRSGIFIINFEHISHLLLVFLLLTLSR